MLYYLMLAAHSQPTSTEGKSMSVEWAIVLFLMLIGLGITLSPPRRTSEVKKPKEE